MSLGPGQVTSASRGAGSQRGLRLRRSPRGVRSQRGSTSPVVVVILMPAAILATAVVVDGGQKIEAVQRATAAAREAARAGTQSLSPVAVAGQGRIDEAAARGAAASFLAGSGYGGAAGSATVSGTTLTVAIDTTVPTRFLSIIGVRSLPVHASHSVELNAVSAGDR